MGLSVTSSAPKGSSVNQGGLTGATPTDATPGEFLAVLSSELSNLFLAPVVDQPQRFENTNRTTEDKPLSLETTESAIPQVDPALLAALSAATASLQNASLSPAQNTPITSTPNTNFTLNTTPTTPTTTDNISTPPNNQAPGAETALFTDITSTPSVIPLNLQSTAKQATKSALTTDIATQTQNFTSAQSAQNPLSLNIGKPISSHQGISLEITQNPAEPPLIQPTFLPPSNNIAPTSIAHSVPAECFETNLTTHIKEKIWSQQFGEKVVWMTKTDVQSAQISLNPPELGPIQITLNLSGDQAKISFASPHLEVRQSIENALPQLKEMLSSSGISLGQANVGANPQQQQRENAFQSTNARHSADENAILSSGEMTIATGNSTSTQQGRGLVDLFA